VTEANEEANAKAFCDEETAKARRSQADKTALYEKFKARLDEAARKKEILTNAVAELQKELAAIDEQPLEDLTRRLAVALSRLRPLHRPQAATGSSGIWLRPQPNQLLGDEVGPTL
jgi:vacuolar-type H+-ATPase subunit E/Vma4